MTADKAESMNVQNQAEEERNSRAGGFWCSLPEGSYKMRCLGMCVCMCERERERETEREIAAVSEAHTFLLTVGLCDSDHVTHTLSLSPLLTSVIVILVSVNFLSGVFFLVLLKQMRQLL